MRTRHFTLFVFYCAFSGIKYYKLKVINMPASAALIKLANVAANTAFKPNCAISLRLAGARAPKPPINIAIDERLAKPHNANVTIA